MQELIDVFRMHELTEQTRINIIIKLGEVINYKYAANITEPLVYELVKALDSNNQQVETEHYKQFIK